MKGFYCVFVHMGVVAGWGDLVCGGFELHLGVSVLV